MAIKKGNETIIKFLLKHGANINAKDKYNNEAVFYATDESIIKLLRPID